MSLTKEELKKLVLEEVVKQELQNEGAITNWLKGQASKGLRAVGSAATKGADALKPEDPSALTPEKKMSLVADFIQMNRNNKLVKNSDLYNKLLSQDVSLKEAYENDILKLMKQKKVNDTDIDKFIQQMSADKNLRKQLQGLKLPVPAESNTNEPIKQPEQATDQKQTDTKIEQGYEKQVQFKRSNGAVQTGTLLTGQKALDALNKHSFSSEQIKQNTLANFQKLGGVVVFKDPQQGQAIKAIDPKTTTPIKTDQSNIPDTSGGPAPQKQELDQKFVRDIVTRLGIFKKANKKRKPQILNKIINDLKNMAQTEGEKDLETANLQEVIVQEIYNVLTGK